MERPKTNQALMPDNRTVPVVHMSALRVIPLGTSPKALYS
jgi:hypothetical protein